MDIKLFDYSLPPDLIAQRPLDLRDHSRLLILDRTDSRIIHDHFYNLGKYLKKGDLLVINRSRVIPCRLLGKKEETGASIECFVLGRKDKTGYNVLLRSAKRLKKGDRVLLGRICFRVLEKHDMGNAVVSFDAPIEEVYESSGVVPLPPYIKSRDIDPERYQTVYADKDGSTAAPTAGLHFTPEMICDLEEQGIIFASISLDIGLGTFRPVSSQNIEDHKMHKEPYLIESSQADIIEKARMEKRRVIAVGTTSARVLETVIKKSGKIVKSSGHTGIYIHPPYQFMAVDSMITNFHLPRSTLLIMVSAFAGRDNILRAYHEAIEKGYRFYSFGDCMFII